MSRGNGSLNEISDLTHRNNGLNSNANINHIHNRTNNNHDEYSLDMRANKNEKVAEDDPLTGNRKWDVEETLKPSFRDKFASTHFFMVIFLLAYILQGTLINLTACDINITVSPFRLLFHVLRECHHNNRETLSYQVCVHRTSSQLQRDWANLHVATSHLFRWPRSPTEMDCLWNVIVLDRRLRICLAALYLWLQALYSRCDSKES